MKKQILNYNAYIARLMAEDNPQMDWRSIAEDYLVKLSFYQHERLIHLIVTVLFALMECMVVVSAVMAEGIGLMVLAFAILILLIPYVGHYYFLENTVQKMYLIYDEIRERAGK
ncbi:MAG: hypothetical protein NC081_07905 [Roseburia sp.]|nr:hypothetical protein [Roseburia sp.]